MCDPTTLAVASFGLNAAGTLADYKAQKDEAAATRAAATQNLTLAYKDLGTRQLEEIQAGTQQRSEITRQVGAAQGSARAGAAGGGVSGVSVDLLVSDLSAQGGRAADSVTQNVDSTVAQLERQKLGARANALNQINQSPYPSFLPSALRLGTAGLSLYSDLRLKQPPKVTTPGPTASASISTPIRRPL